MRTAENYTSPGYAWPQSNLDTKSDVKYLTPSLNLGVLPASLQTQMCVYVYIEFSNTRESFLSKARH